MNVNEFLLWILGSGGAVIILSWLAERSVWFLAQSSGMKKAIFFLLASVISIGSYVVVNYVDPNILVMIDPYFKIITGLFVTIISGQMFHEFDKE